MQTSQPVIPRSSPPRQLGTDLAKEFSPQAEIASTNAMMISSTPNSNIACLMPDSEESKQDLVSCQFAHDETRVLTPRLADLAVQTESAAWVTFVVAAREVGRVGTCAVAVVHEQ